MIPDGVRYHDALIKVESFERNGREDVTVTIPTSYEEQFSKYCKKDWIVILNRIAGEKYTRCTVLFSTETHLTAKQLQLITTETRKDSVKDIISKIKKCAIEAATNGKDYATLSMEDNFSKENIKAIKIFFKDAGFKIKIRRITTEHISFPTEHNISITISWR